MSCYRRQIVPGGTYFFTVRLEDRRSDLLLREIELLRDCLRLCRRRWPFVIDTAVILPDHLHMIWTLPDGDGNFSARWRLIKSSFSRNVPPPGVRAPSKVARGEKGIWQRRFWEHRIRDDADLGVHRDLILTAPVRAGLVARPQDWPFSSIHRDLAAGHPVPVTAASALSPRARAG
ncbi:MAG: transposase [Albidovulum sp.]|uniref:REP-associated tyrosine transposase n=1 Tax=Albidovulum sp. TaxID=1872424 RepID=UPI003C82570F